MQSMDAEIGQRPLVRETDLGGGVDRPVEDVMDPGPVTYRPDTLLAELVERMRASEGRMNRTLVTTADGVLVGLLRQADAERTLHQAHVAHERPPS